MPFFVATKDSSLIWLARDGVEERVMIEKSSDYQIWIEPNQLRQPFKKCAYDGHKPSRTPWPVSLPHTTPEEGLFD